MSKLAPDIFISYTHKDNEPPGEGQKGWVELFHYSLLNLINQLHDDDISIWRDSKTRGNDIISRDVRENIVAAKLLVAILSPRYLRSRWCLRELRWFVKSINKQKTLSTDTKSPIFKVSKTKTDRSRQPQIMRGMTGYRFFHYDESNEFIKHFRQGKGVPYDTDYWENLERLAQDIVKSLKLVVSKKPAPIPAAPAKKAVYLAVPTPDLRSEHKKIKDELETHRYQVLPDEEPVYIESASFLDVIADHLDRSHASIHLVGKNYFDLGQSAKAESIVRLQNQLAAQRLARPNFSRLIWVPPDVKLDDGQQMELVGYGNQQWLNGTEFLQGSLDELKSVMLERLHKSEAKKESNRKKVYLIFDKQDFDLIEPIYQCLFEAGHEVVTPSFDDTSRYIEFHKSKLAMCDAVLIYYGRGDQNWIESHLDYLDTASGIKSMDKSRSEVDMPSSSKLIYVCPPLEGHKRIFNTWKASVLKADGPFKREQLTDFLDLLSHPEKQ